MNEHCTVSENNNVCHCGSPQKIQYLLECQNTFSTMDSWA